MQNALPRLVEEDLLSDIQTCLCMLTGHSVMLGGSRHLSKVTMCGSKGSKSESWIWRALQAAVPATAGKKVIYCLNALWPTAEPLPPSRQTFRRFPGKMRQN